METKEASKFLAVALSFAAIAVYGCGGGGGGGGGGTTTGGGTTVSTAPAGNQAASVGTQSGTMTSGSTQVFSNLGGTLSGIAGPGAPAFRMPSAFTPDPGMGKAIKLSGKFSKTKAMRAAASALKKARMMKAPVQDNGSGNCTDGGTFTYAGSYDDATFAFSQDVTFNNCREEGTQYNGTISVSGSFSNTGSTFTMTMGSGTEPFEMLEFDNNYATLVSSMSMPGTSISFTTSMASQTSITMTMTATGSMNIRDYLAQEDYSMTFTSFKNDLGLTMDATTGMPTAASIITNGGFSETWTDAGGSHSISATFTNYRIDVTMTSTYEEISISGQVVIDFSQVSCFEGTFVFQTQTPVRYDYAMGHESQGHIIINGNTHLIWDMGTITVWVDLDGDNTQDAGETTDYASEYLLGQVCDFATFDEETPTTQSGSGGGTVSGVPSMTTTLTWDSPNSDMDLHLSYYNTQNPPAGSSPTWHLYFGSGPGGACSSDNAIWTDTDIDGVIDAGETVYALLDLDDCSGYGPEHITMGSPLPQGYYIVFVDPWDMCGASACDTSSTVNVSIQLGNNIFTFGQQQFTSDLDPDYMVAGITVDSSGNATIATPRSDLNTGWAPGLRPAAKARR